MFSNIRTEPLQSESLKSFAAVLFGSALSLALPVASHAQTCSAASSSPCFQGLGFLPGWAPKSVAFGVSADGSVVAGSSGLDFGGNTGQAFQWSSGTMTGLAFVPGFTRNSALAINANGSVIVGYNVNSSYNNYMPSRWINGAPSALGHLPGKNAGIAEAVSVDGSVIAGYEQVYGSPVHAFEWQDNVMMALPELPGAVTSNAQGVSADGAIVVGYSGASTDNSIWRAVRWVGGGAVEDLGVLPGTTGSQAIAVNANGSVIVGQGFSTSATKSVLWSNGTMTDLGVVPGKTACVLNAAYAANADGSVVVGECDQVAYYWTSSTGMQSIQDALVSAGVAMTGWSLNRAVGISADGNFVVGYGLDPDGHIQGWAARLPDRQLSVQQLFDRLLAEIQNSDLSFGIKNSLKVKVLAAASSYAEQDTKTSCNQLGAFLNAAGAQSGKKIIPATFAAGLMSDAGEIKSELSCS